MKPINPDWYNTLEFLAGLIPEEEVATLLEEISGSYFNAKIGLFSHPTRTLAFEEERFLLRDVNLAYSMAYDLSLPLHKLPRLLAEEIVPLTSSDYFWHFSGKTQAVLFRSVPSPKKKELVSKIVRRDEKWFKDERDYELNRGFKFDAEGTKLIIGYLTQQREYYFHPSKIVPAEERPFMLAGDLSKHLEKNQETLDLWFNYFNSNLPNKMYAAEILAELGDSRVIKPLAEMLRQPITNPFRGIAPYCWGYENYVKEPIAESLLKMGEAVLPSLMELIKSGEWKGTNEAIWILREMKYKGSQPADTLLHELLPEKEYRKWCKPKKSKK